MTKKSEFPKLHSAGLRGAKATANKLFVMEPEDPVFEDRYYFILVENEDISAGGPYESYEEAADAAQECADAESEDLNNISEWAITKAVATGRCTRAIQWEKI